MSYQDRGPQSCIAYNIISSGSKGNAVILEDIIMVECGVSFKAIKPYIGGLRLVLLTHEHQDHFRESTIRRLASERPTLRFGCGAWLVNDLIQCGISKHLIDVYTMDTFNQYSRFGIETFQLYHNVPNCGYKIHIDGRRALYATDTCKMTTTAQGYDLYMIEANYTEASLQDRLTRKLEEGAEYINELVVPDNHLSEEAAMEWLAKNMGDDSKYVLMHMHEER